MSSSPDSPGAPTGPVQLNGWKEIGAYLGRSVRTAQRWEKDFGLPVRRFGMSKPESVFAIPREIDAWLETAQGISARSGAGPEQEAAAGPGTTRKPVGGPAPEPPFLRRWVLRMALAGVAMSVAVVLIWAAWVSWHVAREERRAPSAQPAEGAPAEWRIDLDSLVVSDSNGTVLWRHQFPFDLSLDAYGGTNPPRHQLCGVADVDGDGRREVWFVTRPADLRPPQESDLYLFNSDGSIRWQYHSTARVRFGQDMFGPSWIVHKVFVTPSPGTGAGRALWAVSYDVALFPSLLQRLDPLTGKPLSAYWSNGYIITLALGAHNSRPALFVGACNNEHRTGSLAVLDATNPEGSAPAELEKYRCTLCPAGAPEAFLVFPKPARFGRSDETGFVERIEPQADGGVTAGIQYAAAGESGNAVAIHTLDSTLSPRSADAADGYLKVYQALVLQGKAPPGAPPTIDPDREFFPILRWDTAAGRFVEVSRRR